MFKELTIKGNAEEVANAIPNIPKMILEEEFGFDGETLKIGDSEENSIERLLRILKRFFKVDVSEDLMLISVIPL